jgi:hypothetical protein
VTDAPLPHLRFPQKKLSNESCTGILLPIFNLINKINKEYEEKSFIF